MLSILCLGTSLLAQEKRMVTDLPDISVIGNFMGTYSEEKKSFDVNEIEFSFQHYLYPGVKANIFTALHKEENGELKYELEEGYVTFSDFFGTLTPNSPFKPRLGVSLGKKLVGIGKHNQLHPEQWAFADKPLALQHFFSGHGLSMEGAQASYLLPTGFFSQLELSYGAVAAHEEEEGAEEAHGVEYESAIVNTRLWNAFELSSSKELEIGLNYLTGNPGADSSNDKQTVAGVDITYTQELKSDRSIKLSAEVFNADYGEEGESKETQLGGYVSGVYQINKLHKAGLRYGTLGKHGDEGKEKNQIAVMLERQLTETSKFRLQYNTGEDVNDAVVVQFIFGMGPHSHVLQ